jgi:hypothetical protein
MPRTILVAIILVPLVYDWRNMGKVYGLNDRRFVDCKFLDRRRGW